MPVRVNDGLTHSRGCYKWHLECAIDRLERITTCARVYRKMIRSGGMYDGHATAVDEDFRKSLEAMPDIF